MTTRLLQIVKQWVVDKLGAVKTCGRPESSHALVRRRCTMSLARNAASCDDDCLTVQCVFCCEASGHITHCKQTNSSERARVETGGADQWVLKRRECSGFARVNKVTSASLGYPLSVFNKNSTLIQSNMDLIAQISLGK